MGDLNLDKTRVGDEGLTHLSRLGLREVRLRGIQVTEEGVAWLRRQCPTLRIVSAFEQHSLPVRGQEAEGGRYLRRLRSWLKRD